MFTELYYSLLKLFKSFDYFGKQINLTINGKSAYSTFTGKILSLLIIILSMISLGYLLIFSPDFTEIIEIKSMNTNKFVVSKGSNNNIDGLQFIISFGLFKNSDFNYILIDKTLINLTITQISRSNSYKEIVKTNLHYDKCETLSNPKKLSIDFINGAYCLITDYQLIGNSTKTSEFSYIKLNIQKCQNQTNFISGVSNCQSKEKIDDFLDNLKFVINLVNIDYFYNDSLQNINSTYQESFQILNSFSIEQTTYLSIDNYRLTRNFMRFYEENIFKSITFSAIESRLKKLNEKSLLSTLIYLNPITINYEIRLKGILIYLNEIGAFLYLFLGISIIFFKRFTSNSLKLKIGNLIYSIISPENESKLLKFEDFLSQKYNKSIINNFPKLTKQVITDEFNLDDLDELFEDSDAQSLRDSSRIIANNDKPVSEIRRGIRNSTVFEKNQNNILGSIIHSRALLKRISQKKLINLNNEDKEIDSTRLREASRLSTPSRKQRFSEFRKSVKDILEKEIQDEEKVIKLDKNLEDKKKENFISPYRRSDFKGRTTRKHIVSSVNRNQKFLNEHNIMEESRKSMKDVNLVTEEEKKAKRDLINQLKELRKMQEKEIMDFEEEEDNAFDIYFKISIIEDLLNLKVGERRKRLREIVAKYNLKIDENKEINKIRQSLKIFENGAKKKGATSKILYTIRKSMNPEAVETEKDNKSVNFLTNALESSKKKLFLNDENDKKQLDYKQVDYFNEIISIRKKQINHKEYYIKKLIFNLSQVEISKGLKFSLFEHIVLLFFKCFMRIFRKKIKNAFSVTEKKYGLFETICNNISLETNIIRIIKKVSEFENLSQIVLDIPQNQIFKLKKKYFDFNSKIELFDRNKAKVKLLKKTVEYDLINKIANKIEKIDLGEKLSNLDKRLLIGLGLEYEELVKIEYSIKHKSNNKLDKFNENTNEIDKKSIYNQTMRNFYYGKSPIKSHFNNK